MASPPYGRVPLPRAVGAIANYSFGALSLGSRHT